MTRTSQFQTQLFRPINTGSDEQWAFIELPKNVSETLPRRGRTTVDASLNGQNSRATLEPDGQLSHWVKVEADLLNLAGVNIGDEVTVEVTSVAQEPEPAVDPSVLSPACGLGRITHPPA